MFLGEVVLLLGSKEVSARDFKKSVVGNISWNQEISPTDLSKNGVPGGFYFLTYANGKLIKKVDLFDAGSEILNDQNN